MRTWLKPESVDTAAADVTSMRVNGRAFARNSSNAVPEPAGYGSRSSSQSTVAPCDERCLRVRNELAIQLLCTCTWACKTGLGSPWCLAQVQAVVTYHGHTWSYKTRGLRGVDAAVH